MSPVFPDSPEEVILQIKDERPLSPCASQTEADIAAYYRIAEEGAAAVVRQTQGGLLRYFLMSIEGRNPKRGRVHAHQHGAFYMKHGRNCFHPKWQTELVVPTDEVVAWAKQHPHGEFGYRTYTEEPWWRK